MKNQQKQSKNDPRNKKINKWRPGPKKKTKEDQKTINND